ncbi:IclR family transcriptional regulator domain-containing protein [Pseudonocardia asaccharolytica]|uniref:IclR family transcriptional regulator n=1 Tax=Pseudonocardia asaccharolytica DSM 44247 = NBRC 16224 TaxID=1123024 RepID=A0A511D666_9PSEU|nr:helix-turn-helix domain-containing protein [Pseudonocardia asaccharolytica]GEL20286.1 IclR family transcriptional regulator [Pseudonocardia asaccharolytica DSM 44247 = NBRC 16224]
MARLADRDGEARRQRELAGAPNPGDFSEALARGLAVLAAFGTERRRLTQADLARELGLSRATVRRAVLTLEHLGYVRADGRSYELTPSVLRLAQSYLASNIVSAVLQPACDRICTRVQESCSVAVLDGADAVMIARAVPNQLIAVGSGVGYRVPALDSSLGKILLAHLDPDELASRLADIDTTAAPVDAGIFDNVRRDGYCYVVNDVEAGFQSVAVPLRRWDGRAIAAMNVGCSVERVPPEVMRGDVLDLLRKEADELRSQLI